MLALEIEWLDGVCRAAREPSSEASDWPIEPDRVFSALVASWGARGERAEEKAALEWLESLPTPHLHSVRSTPRTTVTSFVPPNDATISDIRILPDRRRRQPRQFPASILHGRAGSAHLKIYWSAAPDATTAAALDALAMDTSYVGHSASLVRMRFVVGSHAPDEAQPARAAPYPGRLEELVGLYRRHLDGDANARPRRLVRPLGDGPAALPRSVFGEKWIVLEHASGDRPDIRAAAELGRRLRDALMAAHPDPVPSWLSGHEPDGSPTRDPHLAVVPLSDVGFTHSDGRLMGLGVVLPRTLDEAFAMAATPDAFQSRESFFGAFRALGGGGAAEGGEEETPRTIKLRLGRAGVWRLRRWTRSDAASLQPLRYVGQLEPGQARAAVRWTTATPIALDRHAKGDMEARQLAAAKMVSLACERVGLPPPESVRVHKHSAVTGAPSAWPPGGAPRWTGWARPNALAGRPLAHATISFAAPVRGPVLLGAGRFFGLGLCLPIGREPRR